MNRGLLIGINEYADSQVPTLRGCLNDVQDMAQLLVDRCNFAMSDIRLLVDSRATTDNIIDHIGWLLSGLESGDRCYLHYSGHGHQLPERSPMGEVDNLDEVIIPHDFNLDNPGVHVIRDDDFHRWFSSIPTGVEFIFVSDSCHSADLTSRAIPRSGDSARTFNWPIDLDWRLRTARTLPAVRALTFVRAADEVNAALIAACRSDQTAADSSFNGRANGAFTYFLRERLNAQDGVNVPLTTIVSDVVEELARAEPSFTQVPQLEGLQAIRDRPFLASAS